LPTSRATGSYGERVAAAFLRRHGYRVLCRNFLTPEGEIDLVCRYADVLVFVEVRTRARTDFGRPVESIDPRKENALRAVGERYLRLLENPEIYHRFDAVEVILQSGEIPLCTLLTDLLI
jgi:putative endonuclease